MKLLPVILATLLLPLFAAAEITIASLQPDGSTMPYGVYDAFCPVSNDGFVAFIANIPERADSAANNFRASYLRSASNTTELFPGFNRQLADMLKTYSRLPNFTIAANQDFTRFAIVCQYIITGNTPAGSDVVIPLTMGVRLVVVDDTGHELAKTVLTQETPTVPAAQCHLQFLKDGRLLLSGEQHLGIRIYTTPEQVLDNHYTTIDIEDVIGTAVASGNGEKLFFTRSESIEQRAICCYDLVYDTIEDTGRKASGLIADQELSPSYDGSVVAYRQSSSALAILQKESNQWRETVISIPHPRHPILSADAQAIVYQADGDEHTQIYRYDCATRAITMISCDADGAPANNNCTSPSVSPDGRCLTFVSAATNLGGNTLGTAQAFLVAPPRQSVTFNLKKGWNLCAVTFTPDHVSQQRLFNSGDCWRWSNGHFIQSAATAAGEGFWLHVPNAMQLTLTGLADAPAPLVSGWNLVAAAAYPKGLPNRFMLKDYTYIKAPAGNTAACWSYIRR